MWRQCSCGYDFGDPSLPGSTPVSRAGKTGETRGRITRRLLEPRQNEAIASLRLWQSSLGARGDSGKIEAWKSRPRVLWKNSGSAPIVTLPNSGRGSNARAVTTLSLRPANALLRKAGTGAMSGGSRLLRIGRRRRPPCAPFACGWRAFGLFSRLASLPFTTPGIDGQGIQSLLIVCFSLFYFLAISVAEEGSSA